MKIQAFGVSYWCNCMKDNYINWLLVEHYNRVKKFLPENDFFYAPGSYSDPNECPVKNVEIVQIGVLNTYPYSRNWNYWYVGFLTGIYKALLNPNWDLLIHIQDRTLLGQDLTPIIEEFMERPEIICAPKILGQIGVGLETGLMIMKPQAAKIYATEHYRTPLSLKYQPNVEEEAFELFRDKWWNPWSDIITIRQRDCIPQDILAINLEDKYFLDLPFIAAGKHSDKELVKKWIEKYPCNY